MESVLIENLKSSLSAFDGMQLNVRVENYHCKVDLKKSVHCVPKLNYSLLTINSSDSYWIDNEEKRKGVNACDEHRLLLNFNFF